MARLRGWSLLPSVLLGLSAAFLSLAACGIEVVGGDDDDTSDTPAGDDDTFSSPTPTSTPVDLPEFAIDVSPLNLKFGNVTVGEAKTAYVTYTNIGAEILHPKDLLLSSSTPQVFAFEALTDFELSPQESVIIPITFRPNYNSNYSYNGVLSLVLEESEGASVPSVYITGRGVVGTGGTTAAGQP